MVESIDKLKINIIEERKILERIASMNAQMHDLQIQGLIKDVERLEKTIEALKKQLKIVNDSIPKLIKEVSLAKKIPESLSKKNKNTTKKEDIVSVEKKGDEGVGVLYLKGKDKDKFLKELNIEEQSLKQISKKKKSKEEKVKEFKKANSYAKLSNRFFLETSNKLIAKGNFKKLRIDLRKANFMVLLSTYVSMMFFTIVLSFFISLFVWVFLGFFILSIEEPFISLRQDSLLLGFLKNIWVIFAFPLLTFISFYFYPSTEKGSIAKRIDQELPFIAIHMSAIASSGVEPSQIFKIIAMSKDYKRTSQEAKKIMNQINLYGYDLVNALQNISRATPSKRLSELLNGLGTTINTGGSLVDFLDKRSESLLFEYKLEREKYTRVAESFMDIYISIAIAAPMLMMLLLIMIVVTGLGIGMSLEALTFLMISVVVLMNIVFLVFLHLKQPGF